MITIRQAAVRGHLLASAWISGSIAGVARNRKKQRAASEGEEGEDEGWRDSGVRRREESSH